ncbi:class I SAM-dependent methyltransferase [Knoellia aerolata]|nr:methyltransferase domain-containing protein [Knoellia aerolata]
MRHSRTREFERALAAGDEGVARWSDLADDPNDPAALAYRARTLRAAWRDAIPDRGEFIIDRARGRRVLDIGCVAHDVERMKSPLWLHGRVAAAAATCVGVDVLDEGVAHMTSLGYDAISHDLTQGTGPVADRGPFDVIVAGELIEHVPAMDMLFRAARDLLADGGELIVTTPNPWAPHRVRAGQRGDCWENTDHILFAFPSGMAELAERYGLVLSEAATTSPRRVLPSGFRGVARSARRRLRGTAWVRTGYATMGDGRVVDVPGRMRLSGARTGRARFIGETFVYVVRRPEVRA